MNIGFYGHSASSIRGDPRSLIDIVEKHFNANIVNTGVLQGSEERIYHDLKKTRGRVDVAVIFHGIPRYAYIPSCNRDLALNTVPSAKAKHLWREQLDNPRPVTDEEFSQDFFEPSINIKRVFGDADTFVNAMVTYKEYFWSAELYQNRWECALLGIDNFCNTEVPLTIHVIMSKVMPPWYPRPKSGITSDRIGEIIRMSKPPDPNQEYLKNYLNVVDNKLIAEELISLINENYNAERR